MNTKIGVIVLALAFALSGTAFAHGNWYKGQTNMNRQPMKYTSFTEKRVIGPAALPLRRLLEARNSFIAGEKYKTAALLKNVSSMLYFKAGAAEPGTRDQFIKESLAIRDLAVGVVHGRVKTVEPIDRAITGVGYILASHYLAEAGYSWDNNRPKWAGHDMAVAAYSLKCAMTVGGAPLSPEAEDAINGSLKLGRNMYNGWTVGDMEVNNSLRDLRVQYDVLASTMTPTPPIG